MSNARKPLPPCFKNDFEDWVLNRAQPIQSIDLVAIGLGDVDQKGKEATTLQVTKNLFCKNLLR